MGKRVVLLVGMLLGMLASGVQAEGIDLDGYVFTEARLGHQTYLKTGQRNWHYDDGTLLGFRLVLPIIENAKISIAEAGIFTNLGEGAQNGVGVGVVGQRFEAALELHSLPELFNVGIKYHFYSWFVGDEDTYGPAYMINRDHTVHQVFINADFKLF